MFSLHVLGESSLVTHLHSEWPKLNRVLAVLCAKGLKLHVFSSNNQDASSPQDSYEANKLTFYKKH